MAFVRRMLNAWCSSFGLVGEVKGAWMAVYLIHFEERYRHAGHYLGYSSDLERRLQAHRQSCGARLLEVVNGAGIAWSVVRVWLDGDYDLERQLKALHNGPRLCPRCNPKVADFAVEKQQCVLEEGMDAGGFYLWLLSQPEGVTVGWADEPLKCPLG